MIRPVETTLVAQLTGRESINHTADRFGIHATDLGIMWEDGDGRVMVVFGDTYGEGLVRRRCRHHRRCRLALQRAGHLHQPGPGQRVAARRGAATG